MHHSQFRPGIQGYANVPERGKYHRGRQAMFLKSAKKADIDLVLAGHNHSYTRASYGKDVGPGLPVENANEALRTDRSIDMVVVVSISGAMSGTMTPERFHKGNGQKFGDDLALERWANNTPTFQIIDVESDTLSFRSYLGTAELYDAFTVSKDTEGNKILTNGDATFGEVRRFETTGPYLNKNDLR